MKKKPVIIIVVIVTVSVIIFALTMLLNNQTPISMVEVHGTVTGNSTLIPSFVGFTYVGTTTVKVESGYYSVTLPNNRSYQVDITYDYKIPPPMPKFTGPVPIIGPPECFIRSFDLHANSNQFEYDISCPKM